MEALDLIEIESAIENYIEEKTGRNIKVNILKGMQGAPKMFIAMHINRAVEIYHTIQHRKENENDIRYTGYNL